MKLRIALLLAFLILFSSLAEADVSNWETANQISVAWDPSTMLSDGSPLPQGNSISYSLFYKPIGSTSPPVGAGSVTTTQATITFASEGKFVVGVKAVRLDPTGSLISESIISWSDDIAVVSSAGTFGVIYFLSPSGIKGLRLK